MKAIRERYTATFVYLDAKRTQVGANSEIYDSVDGFEIGSASIITKMANITAHCGKVAHLMKADLFSATLKCHDTSGELYFANLSR